MKSDPPMVDGIVEYSMGYYADEFGKVLTGPFCGERAPFACTALGPHRWRIDHPSSDGSLTVEVAAQPPRRLGLFNLPVLRVRFDCGALSDDIRGEFFTRFHQYFHKGGG